MENIWENIWNILENDIHMENDMNHIYICIIIPYSQWKIQWIGLRENLQETIDVPIIYGVFLKKKPLNQSIEKMGNIHMELIGK